MKTSTQRRKGAKAAAKRMTRRPPEDSLYSVVGMRRAHIGGGMFAPDGILMLCGLVLSQWRGSDGKRICKHCLKEWRAGR